LKSSLFCTYSVPNEKPKRQQYRMEPCYYFKMGHLNNYGGINILGCGNEDPLGLNF